MAGTETGMKWLGRKIASLKKPDSEEGKITQTEAYRHPVPLEKMLGDSADSAEARKDSVDKRMNMREESREIEGKKTGGAIKAKGWGKARGARAAKIY